jgi:hypothetical protein
MAVFCVAALAQSLTVAKLEEFLRSASERKDADKDVAAYLSHAKMAEKLDDPTIQKWQSEGIVQPKTLHALWALRDQSASLSAAAPKPAGPVTKVPGPRPPSNEEQAAIIQEVRQYALNYSRNLPDFICTEQVKRYIAPPPRNGDHPAWREGDTLLIRLSYFQQKEQYKLTMINFKPADQDYEKVGGSKEFGSFGTLLRGIFEPASQARFEYDHISQLGDRGVVLAFRYYVDLEHSNYELVWENSRRIKTAYSGMLLIARDSHRVMRVTVKAEGIPAGFPIQGAETQLDYDWVDLSGQKFLLPSSAQVLMAGDNMLTKNDERFAVYRKYSAESEIKYDTEPLPPEAPDKAKEIKK